MNALHVTHRILIAGLILAAGVSAAAAQTPPVEPQPRVIVVGDGSVTAPPDYAQIGCGVTTTANTAKEATDANSKAMGAVTAALSGAGVDRNDIQTSRFSLQPVYAPPQPNAAPKLTGFSVTNRLTVIVRSTGKVGDILDRLIAAGANDIGEIEFQHSDMSKLLDQARAAAIADARRKADIYARAAGVTLGRVVWISEESGDTPPLPFGGAMRAAARPVPIAAGEDTLHVRVTVGFDLAH